jgi:general secretion pathway protein G
MNRIIFLLSLSAFLIAIITLLFVFQLHPLQSLYVIGKASSAITGRDEGYYAELAREQNTRDQMEQLKQALVLYKFDNGFYPETQQGLMALIQRPMVGREPCCYSKSSYLEGGEVPLDGWGGDYVYLGSDTLGLEGYELVSKGADQTLSTDDDIIVFSYGRPR